MKTLQQKAKIVYRFRCFKCRSLFEMTEEEKLDNDWRFDSRPNKDDLRAKGQHPRNSLDNFNCPVCNDVSFPKKIDTRKVAIMDDGTEINC